MGINDLKHERARIEDEMIKLRATQPMIVPENMCSEKSSNESDDSIVFTRAHLQKLEYSYEASRIALKTCVVWLTVIGIIGIMVFLWSVHL